MTKQTTQSRPVPALPALKPVENITLREQVTLSVRNALMNGHFQPGQTITVKAISTMLGASVMPAREAMNRLIAEGALELRANRSVIVPVLSRQEFDELTALRCHIEGLAASQAVDRVEPEHIARLKDFDAAMWAAVAAADADAYLDSNFQFNFLIYRLGTSSYVLSIIEKLWVRVGPLIRFCLNESGFSDSSRVHAEVIRGLETKDSIALRAAIHADIMGAAQTIRAAHDAAASNA
jgi:DNA-binding GntR family transcriptional regulator